MDNNWNYLNKYEILKGTGNSDESVIWENYNLISENVRTGRFAVFLFQRQLADAKYEYLIKRVKFE